MVFEHFFDGINMQILNCPLNMFVEDKLFEIEEMRPIQLLSLYRLQKEYIPRANNKKIRSQLPLDLLRANMVMNMCSAMHLNKLYGVDVVDQYNATRNEFAQAKDMFDEYCAYVDTFKTGDEYELVEYFAESLNMTDYISIVDEDEYIESKKIAQQTKEEADQVIYDKIHKTAEDIDVANAKFALKHQDGADASETMMMAMYAGSDGFL